MPVFTRPPKKANKPSAKINTENADPHHEIKATPISRPTEALAAIEEVLQSMTLVGVSPAVKVEPQDVLRWIIAYAEEGMEYEYGGEFDLMITAAAAAYKKKSNTAFPKESKKARRDGPNVTKTSNIPSKGEEDEEEWHDEDTRGSFNPADPKCKCAIS
ncbi:hypothetical protein PRIPAC_71843 [Pristionchus pacificus]|uniref:Uncharacterized protein n=1 Tax=Pristionchus pacificus TaxID=54126 RepID=A0A2A6B504_PRIPA|nr:hypothetical protein PRIPAC_71843 [Pristionchus pacificus]|eukprot:PDM60952.1 hypothetical protein PRIPAC_54758 [Pristionchus pacificus]